MGVASWVCVLPIFIISLNSFFFYSRASANAFRAGKSCVYIAYIAAICIAVGKESFED
jgi:hypothetical protein